MTPWGGLFGQSPKTEEEIMYLRRCVCPECEQGKHDNCDGTAWNAAADDIDVCDCAEGSHVHEGAH